MRIKKIKKNKISGIDILKDSSPLQMTEEERVSMTISCEDSNYIPKVKNAGKIVEEDGRKLQIMHNGVKVIAGGYYGKLIEEITEKLKGHHEPQEEKVFYEILKRIDAPNPTMIELGSFWAYYSLWFKRSFVDSKVVCCEPDPQNIEVGRENMIINGYQEDGDSLVFHQSAAGSEDLKEIIFNLDSSPGTKVKVPVYSVDGILQRSKIDKIDVLHIDVQGAEYDALIGAEKSILQRKIRFVVVSTHHYVFSDNPVTHQECEKYLVSKGANIIASHGIEASFSGDGLIVASFDKRDSGFKVDISINQGRALFRSYEEDLSIMLQAFDDRNS